MTPPSYPPSLLFRGAVAALLVAAAAVLSSCSTVRQGIASLGLTCADAQQVVDQVCKLPEEPKP